MESTETTTRDGTFMKELGEWQKGMDMAGLVAYSENTSFTLGELEDGFRVTERFC
jgi:hypothetical protein